MWGEGDHGHETVLVILYGCTKMKVQLLEFVIILPLNHRFHFPVTGIGPFVKVEKKTDKMIECSNSGEIMEGGTNELWRWWVVEKAPQSFGDGAMLDKMKHSLFCCIPSTWTGQKEAMIQHANIEGIDEVVMMRLMEDEASQLFEHPPPFLHGDMWALPSVGDEWNVVASRVESFWEMSEWITFFKVLDGLLSKFWL